MATLGSLQVSEAGVYGDELFRVEEFGFWSSPEPSWATPDWIERGLPDLAGPFASRELAQAALSEFLAELAA